METLLSTYKGLLTSIGCVIDDDGLISNKMGEDITPLMCNKKRLVLPIRKVLNESRWDQLQAFHPLGESAVLGQSPVIKKLRVMITAWLHYAMPEVLLAILGLAADSQRHNNLTPDQLSFLQNLPEVNNKTVDVLSNILMKAGSGNDHRVVNIYLAQGGKINNQSYRRTAYVSFPLLKDLQDSAQEKVWDVEVGKRNRAALIKLFLTVFPNAGVENSYSMGSDDDTAPNLHALTGAFVNVQRTLNHVVDLFHKFIPNADELKRDLSFFENFKDLRKFIGQIPNLAGNDGERPVAGGGVAAAPLPTGNVVVPKATPVQTKAPTTVTSTPAVAATATAAPVAAASPFLTPSLYPAVAVPTTTNSILPPLNVSVVSSMGADAEPGKPTQSSNNNNSGGDDGSRWENFVNARNMGMIPGMMPTTMMPGMMPGMVPGMAMPGMAPAVMAGVMAMPGMMPGMVPGMVPGMTPGMPMVGGFQGFATVAGSQVQQQQPMTTGMMPGVMPGMMPAWNTGGGFNIG